MDAKELLLELVNMVKELSPEVWAVYLLQVKVLLIRHSILAGVFGIVTIFCGFSIKPCIKYGEEHRYYEDLVWLPAAVGTITLSLVLANILRIVGYIVNPAYKAIELLLDVVK